MTKLHLGDFLSTLMRERNESSVGVATELGVPVTTLKSWLQRNSYPMEALKSLASRYRLPAELVDLQQRFEFKLSRNPRSMVGAEAVEEFATALPIPLGRNEAIGSDHWAFMERNTEAEALAALQAGLGIPIGILGGPRTGKSTVLLHLQAQMNDHFLVVVDFASLATAQRGRDPAEPNPAEQPSGEEVIRAALDDAFQESFPNASRLREMRHLPRWLNRVIADHADRRRLLLVLDGIEQLPPSQYVALSIGLHYLKNGREYFSELRHVDVVYSVDPVIQREQELIHSSSRFLGTYGLLFDVRQIPDRLIETTLARALTAAKMDEVKRTQISRKLTSYIYDKLSHGHPWLTQLSIAGIQEAVSLHAAAGTVNEITLAGLEAIAATGFTTGLAELVSYPSKTTGNNSPQENYCVGSFKKNMNKKDSNIRLIEGAYDYSDAQVWAVEQVDQKIPLLVDEDGKSLSFEFTDLRRSLLFHDHDPGKIHMTEGVYKNFSAR
jgi:hypothetical protein